MLSHLLELRKRALHVILIFISLFLLFFFYSDFLFHALVKPLLKALPNQNSIIAIQLTSGVLTPIKLAGDAAMLCCAPFALLQLWYFVAPGLYRQERSHLKSAIISILFLFCTGILFCFYLVLPLLFQFFAKATPLGVRLMPDINHALDFITTMLLLFGLCFQIPILSLTLVRLKWLDLVGLKKIRPYWIVLAFILGMLLTPDLFSQIMLAIPLCLLYELGIVLVKLRNYKILQLQRQTL